jgi:aryl-alcohol dehydrogenase-like predicted oxidoreductase
MRTGHQTRREFARTVAAAPAVLLAGTAAAQPPARLPRRALGKTGIEVPILGLGTVSIGHLTDRKEAEALLNRAIDLGVTYIDTAPPGTRIAPVTGYVAAQRYLNGVLKERRKEVFLVTKCLETDGKRTLDLLKRNLRELGVEQVDLTHTHSIGHAVYDLDALAADGGPMAALEQARADGLTRFVGVTGHNRPEKFARLLAMRDVDAMMNAVNLVDRHTYAFEDVVWPLARKKRVGLVAMKVYGGGVDKCKRL